MTYRVIQWATGAMGRTCLQAVLDHPAMELVGVYVYGDKKAGKDAGEIARREPIGIKATSNVQEILDLEADVVLHCAMIMPPYGYHDAELIQLLESGKNVITINGYSFPDHWSSERVARLREACEKGNSTLMAGGLNPGYAGDQLAIVASGACSSLENIEVTENVDCREVKNAEYVFNSLGFGSDLSTFDPNDPSWGPASILNGMYSEVVAAMAEHLRVKLDSVETDHKVFPATKDITIMAGTIAEGTVSHVYWKWHGVIKGERRLTMGINWYMEQAHLEKTDPSLWSIRVRGEPCVLIDVDFAKRADDETRVTVEQLAVAGAVVNTIPVICEAETGMVLRPIATPVRANLLNW